MDEALVALQLKTGETEWETALGGRPGAPLAVGGKVYVSATDKQFYAIDADSGRLDWPRRVGAAPRGRAVADERYLYFVALDNVLRALDRGHGALKWMRGLPYRPGPSGPVAHRQRPRRPWRRDDAAGVRARRIRATDRSRCRRHSSGSRTAIAGTSGHPVVAVITGDLEHPWTLTLLETFHRAAADSARAAYRDAWRDDRNRPAGVMRRKLVADGGLQPWKRPP